MPINDFLTPINHSHMPINDFLMPISDFLAPINDSLATINDSPMPNNDSPVPINDSPRALRRLQTFARLTTMPINGSPVASGPVEAPPLFYLPAPLPLCPSAFFDSLSRLCYNAQRRLARYRR